jgi:hypothetical protein
MKKKNGRLFRVTLIAWVAMTGLACIGMIATKVLGHDEAAVRWCFSPALLATAVVFGHLAWVQWDERDRLRRMSAAKAVATACFALALAGFAAYTTWNPRPQIRINLDASR